MIPGQRVSPETERDPIDVIRDELAAAWSDPSQERQIAWDLHLRVGTVRDR